MEALGNFIVMLIYVLLNLFLSLFLGGLSYFLIINAFRFSIHMWNFSESNNFEFSLLDKNEEFSSPIKSIKKVHRIGSIITIIIFSIGFHYDKNISSYPIGESFYEFAIGIVVCVIGLAIINSFIANHIRSTIRYQIIELINPAYNTFDETEKLIKENEQNLTHNDLLSIQAYRDELGKKSELYIRKVNMFEHFLFNNFPKAKIGNVEIKNIYYVKRIFK